MKSAVGCETPGSKAAQERGVKKSRQTVLGFSAADLLVWAAIVALVAAVAITAL